MKDITTTWTKKELKAYLLLYCANADFVITEEEKKLMRSKVEDAAFEQVRQEFETDSDYERIQKIMSTTERLGYSNDQINILMADMKSVFLSDGSYDILEKNMFTALKRILRQPPS